MKAVVALAVFACLAAMAAASGYGHGHHGHGHHGHGHGHHGHGHYNPGFKRTHNGISAAYNNAERQEAVNHKAEYIGRSSGTARWYGVPGTGLNFGYGYGHGHGHHGHGHHGHGHGHSHGYGHDGHHH